MRDLLDAVMTAVADAIYLVGPRGEVRFVNPAGLSVLGYDAPEELIGRDSHATIHNRHPDGSPYPPEECPLLAARSAGRTIRVEHDWFVRRDGSMVPVAYASTPLEIDGGNGAVVVFRDITERLAAEEAHARAIAEEARADELAASRARIVAAADEERRRIGRDLHDGAQQRLVRVLMKLEQARRATPAPGDAAEETRGAAAEDAAPGAAAEDARAAALDAAAEETRKAVRELRELAHGIHPAVLTDQGLAAALEDLTADSPLPVELSLEETRHPADVEAAAYFFVAEALANVAKHAQAGTACVATARDDGSLVVTVSDDGRGGADPLGGSGLRGLADRLAALGGTLAVDSRRGGGTTLRATLPL